MSAQEISGIAMASVYAREYDESFRFYHDVLGLQKWSPMGENACYFHLPDERGLYLIGGRTLIGASYHTVRTTFAFTVPSASAVFAVLQAAGVETVQETPMDMGQGFWWFECYDPSHNIVEFLGGR